MPTKLYKKQVKKQGNVVKWNTYRQWFFKPRVHKHLQLLFQSIDALFEFLIVNIKLQQTDITMT